MKVTVILRDELIKEALEYTKAETITEALKIALKGYISNQKLKKMSLSILQEPLEFKYSAKELREKNNLREL
ncbi:type II toxin-antitoxin system VapB family antitoxin [Aquiflexum sp. TKW24L]|uniref:type II toxin-antitoxin system VapB family antitoxin n=1 Tax=Aquiflexum sp. TKW24L TaxID=2942212 RepID=UPI0020C14B21|nr:type II toxin-antitoxin system VapB family antitoxin [Aquiflexum sp. TKW24L]MCL6261684.1 type II toxin-antitoxin system VapB family antitoxin [Aquiflexum sp. TKW24L]